MMRLSFSSRIPRTMMLRRSFARLVRIPPIPDLTGANLHQAWGQKPAWNTDQDPRPRMLWWELPGFDFVDWQKSMDRSFSRNTNTTEPDAPALSPAVRVRTGLINKGWSARTMFWFVVGLFSVFYFAHAIQERSRNEARDEMARWNTVASVANLAEKQLHTFVQDQVLDYHYAEHAARFPILRDYAFFHNKEISPDPEWQRYNFMFTPTLDWHARF